jgi:hypothetical protein
MSSYAHSRTVFAAVNLLPVPWEPKRICQLYLFRVAANSIPPVGKIRESSINSSETDM